MEFAIFGRLFQAGRSTWGSAGMGGNGQFNSWRALEAVGESNNGNPWRDKLTEDQDLGLRLFLAGYKLHHDNRAFVEQQGLNNLRSLIKQRTRWSQGNLQAINLLPTLVRKKLNIKRVAKAELIVSLLMPFYQAFVGISFLSAIYFWVFNGIEFWNSNGIIWLILIYLLGFSGVILGCIAAKKGEGVKGVILGFLVAQVYAFYTWILWPVLIRSGTRQLFHRDSWAKTSREKIK